MQQSKPFKPQTANYRNGAKTIAYYEDETFKPYPQDARFMVSDRGSVYDTQDQVLLVPHNANWMANPDKDAGVYQRYHLIGHYGSVNAHRLVLETFAPNPNASNLDVNHIDGVKWNNRWSPNPYINNLEWTTRSENVSHAYRTGLNSAPKGYTANTPEKIHAICQLLQKGYSSRQVAEALGYTGFNIYRLISDLRLGRSWRNVTSQYCLPQATRHSEEEVIMICELIMENLDDEQVAQEMAKAGYTVKSSYVKSIRYGNAVWYGIIKNYDFPDRRVRPYSEEQVHTCCQMMRDGLDHEEIAAALGVEDNDVFKGFLSHLRCGHTYPQITSQYNLKRKYREQLSKETVQRICSCLVRGLNSTQIAQEVGIEPNQSFVSIVSQIRTGKLYKEEYRQAIDESLEAKKGGFTVVLKKDLNKPSR